MLKLRPLFLLVITVPLITACLERRTTGTVIDDQNIEYRVINAIFSDEIIGSESHIKVEVYESAVLLMGETDSDEKRQHAESLAAEVDQVKRVVNEIQVKEELGFGGRMGNTWLTAKVNTALVSENAVPGFDATRIKVISSDNTVYLMGNVTREEADAVTEVARNVGGVERVVKVFNYTD